MVAFLQATSIGHLSEAACFAAPFQNRLSSNKLCGYFSESITLNNFENMEHVVVTLHWQ